jgi:ring-1,2-phenylacetyl-CoA epoxidase subunit PaaD
MVSVSDVPTLRRLVAGVPDPEIPVLTIDDLGVLRDVCIGDDGRVEVTITPTYSGCPAMDVIATDIKQRLADNGLDGVVRTVLSPAWTTDWMSEEGRAKLTAYGIAAPGTRTDGLIDIQLSARCPQCGSLDTRQVSRFGSTACQAHWVCRACAEPFDEFKAH